MPPGIEQMLWFYAVGKPREHVELSGSIGTRDVREMSTEELLTELTEHHRATAELLQQHGTRATPEQGD